MFTEKQIVKFLSGDGKKRFGVIDIVKEDSLWVSQIIFKGGYVCKYENVIENYGLLSIDEFRDKYPECNI